ncbi:hypothetical protein CEXT_229831 [Caerostris extrusa]|uniref:Uncharacterized protein n=1 Tax=Caerostris extrusa TaxID=172846 RepID=A0AAV4MNU1_CAEEX|nr:hypothetical protein CEXT_229831 [Caerostris extrusa]
MVQTIPYKSEDEPSSMRRRVEGTCRDAVHVGVEWQTTCAAVPCQLPPLRKLVRTSNFEQMSSPVEKCRANRMLGLLRLPIAGRFNRSQHVSSDIEDTVTQNSLLATF